MHVVASNLMPNLDNSKEASPETVPQRLYRVASLSVRLYRRFTGRKSLRSRPLVVARQ